ncbi:MAG: cytochrome c, class I [Magnetococcales bacterium]|nr:cytochrome c, class I [Magnetococcales bacterium]
MKLMKRLMAGTVAGVLLATLYVSATRAADAPAPAPAAGVNTFNRLMKPKSERNPPPMQDGIHDPSNEGTGLLQPPKEAFKELPEISSGNYVDWVQALGKQLIKPRYDRKNPNEEPVVLDLDIVREVKGTMPDVVYPHDRHTMWLDCSNCHPDIFIPEKGKNQISMAMILMGQKCGVCHGKVAFPVAECRKCHSKKKDGSGGGKPAAQAEPAKKPAK